MCSMANEFMASLNCIVKPCLNHLINKGKKILIPSGSIPQVPSEFLALAKERHLAKTLERRTGEMQILSIFLPVSAVRCISSMASRQERSTRVPNSPALQSHRK